MFARQIAFTAVLVSILTGSIGASTAAAALYPTLACVSEKQQGLGAYCDRVLGAWAKWGDEQDAAKRAARIQQALAQLEQLWASEEAIAAEAGSDCADLALTAGSAAAIIDAAAADIVMQISDGLDLGDKGDAKCARNLLEAAANKCRAFLTAEGESLTRLATDPVGSQRAADQDRARQRFSRDWAKSVSKGCTPNATEDGIEGLVDALADRLVFDTVAAANLDDSQFTTISPTGTIEYEGRALSPTCVFGTPYHYFVKRGTVNKLLVYYQGGGACWEQLTCMVPVCDASVNPAGSDNPNNGSSGFADRANPNNPFKDWHAVFVSYCSCDIHFGDAAQDYDNINPASPLHVEHRGFPNAKVVEKWAREHFLNPEVVFVTGSSAGAYGAWFHAPLLHEVWPAAQFHVLADAGNGVITKTFLDNFFPNWNFEANLPDNIPGLVEVIQEGSGIPGYTKIVADVFPNTNWAHYTTAFDGGSGGQTGFYNIMLNDNNPLAGLTWWNGSCAFNAVMRQQAFDTAAAIPSNYRFFIGTGSRHTMVEWVNAMLTSPPGAPDPGWVNVEANPFNVLLSGDPRPPTLPTPPFELSDGDVVVNCP
jgi:Pectinacetylesterase